MYHWDFLHKAVGWPEKKERKNADFSWLQNSSTATAETRTIFKKTCIIVYLLFTGELLCAIAHWNHSTIYCKPL